MISWALSNIPLPQVWLARCVPLEEEVALKIIEMDNMACDLVSWAARTRRWHEGGKGASC